MTDGQLSQPVWLGVKHFLNLESQVPVFISPRNRVAQLYPQATDSLFVTYNKQGYSGGIRTCLHVGTDC
jgi:hypothetical protein